MQEVNIEENISSSYTNVYYDYLPWAHAGYKQNTVLEKAIVEQPSWWKDLAPFYNGCKTVNEFMDKHEDEFWELDRDAVFATSKRCPAIIGHFSNSIIIKSPCDIAIKINDDSFEWKAPGKKIYIDLHNDRQVGSLPYNILKICLPIVIKSDPGTTASFITPTLYNDLGYELAPGVTDTNEVNQLHLIILVSKKKTTYFIPADSVLAVMQFSKKVKNIVQGDLLQAHYERGWNGTKYIGKVKK